MLSKGLLFSNQWTVNGLINETSGKITNLETIEISKSELKQLPINTIPNGPQLTISNARSRGKINGAIEIYPIFYNKGVLTETIIEKIISLANSKNIPTIVDPKKQNFLSYKECTLFKPNLKEINEGLNTNPDINNFSEIEETTSKLRKIISAKAILLTLSNKGIFLNTRNGSKIKESTTSNVIDVSGAGDTVVSVAAMCLACNIDFEELAILSNIAGGIVCEKVGVVPITNKELLDRAKKLLYV